MIESETLHHISDLDGFQCPEEFLEDYNLYLDWIQDEIMQPVTFWDSERDEIVGFGGVYEAEWGWTASLIAGENLKNPLSFYRMMVYLLEKFKQRGIPLYCHNTQGSKSHRMMRRLGFELVLVLQTEKDTVLRWRTKGDDDGS